MSRVINITDKLSNDKPSITIGEKSYEINDTLEVVFKFEEVASTGNKGAIDALKMALGEKACKEIGVEKLSINNFKVLMTALMAAMQGVSYEDAEARFRV